MQLPSITFILHLVSYNTAYLIKTSITIPGNMLNVDRFLYSEAMHYGQKSSNGDKALTQS